MLQRRTPQVGRANNGAGVSSPAEAARIVRPGLGSTASQLSSSRNIRFSPWILVLMAAALTLISYMLPEVQQAEHDVVQGAYTAEKDLINWWSSNGQQKPPIPVTVGNDPHADHRNIAELRKAATERMMKQESKWVDGEKKLKAKLKLLVARQQEGKDLGVPVATRWVGDDIPAWAGEGVNVDEWNAKIKERYDAMRLEEDHWREMVTATLKSDSRG